MYVLRDRCTASLLSAEAGRFINITSAELLNIQLDFGFKAPTITQPRGEVEATAKKNNQN